MKKAVLVLMLGLFGVAQAAEYVSRVIRPDTNNVAVVTNDFATLATPVTVYTEVDTTSNNVVSVTYIPSVATNAADYGKVYRIGGFTTVGGSEQAVIMNSSTATNTLGSVVLNRGDVMKLTGVGAIANTSVWYRVVFQTK